MTTLITPFTVTAFAFLVTLYAWFCTTRAERENALPSRPLFFANLVLLIVNATLLAWNSFDVLARLLK